MGGPIVHRRLFVHNAASMLNLRFLNTNSELYAVCMISLTRALGVLGENCLVLPGFFLFTTRNHVYNTQSCYLDNASLLCKDYH